MNLTNRVGPIMFECMSVVTIHEAKAQLSALIEQSLQGEEVVIARRNQPLVRLVPIEPHSVGGRVLGTARGRLVISEDFDEGDFGFGAYLP